MAQPDVPNLMAAAMDAMAERMNAKPPEFQEAFAQWADSLPRGRRS